MAINKKSSQTTKPERLIYVGPSYKNGKLLKYQVFIGGLPTHIDDVFEKCPQIKKLFVAVSELPEAERAIAKAGTPMNKYTKLLFWQKRRNNIWHISMAYIHLRCQHLLFRQ